MIDLFCIKTLSFFSSPFQRIKILSLKIKLIIPTAFICKRFDIHGYNILERLKNFFEC